MTKVLQGNEAFAVVYMDDVMIFSKTEQDHLKHLDRVFAQLDKESYHIRLPKCEFMKEEVEFLGHLLSANGVRTSPLKVKCITSMETTSADS